ncbi:peptide chain release factor 1 [Opitutales bacterium]|jgi:peptide chain release factor 1|nr:peptide chain release factor 1 [Opitutales bacterium]
MENLPKVDPFRQRYNDLEMQLSEPDIFKDAALARDLSREHNRIQAILEIYDCASDCLKELNQLDDLLNDPELKETAEEEIDSLQHKFSALHEKLLLAMLPEDPDAGRNTIVEIRAGAGGDEASLFAADLYRMYCKYGEKCGWTFECLGQSPSETGGFKEIFFVFKSEEAWSRMRFESGVHRVQRIPITEAGGRIHTSTATVAVLPEAREVEIKIDPNDLEINVCRASGPGGQGVNTTDSAVQLLHKPSGISVYCADERSQLKNKSKAMTVLRARLLKAGQAEEDAKYAQERKEQVGSGDRSERVRTYNFPQSRITDHRINYTSHSLGDTMLGELDHLIDALQEYDQKCKLSELIEKANG